MGLFPGIKDFFEKISSAPADLPEIILIPAVNTDEEAELTSLFEPGKHYFTIRVNELYLTKQKKWFDTIEPTVLVITQFQYDGKDIEQPCVVGPALLDGKMKKIPNGMLFHDTRVAGIHPFAGGRIITSIVLCEFKTNDGIRNMLEFISKITGIFGGSIAKMVTQYITTSKTVIEGIDIFIKNGDLKPIMGYRKEFDIDANDKLQPGYFVLLNKSPQEWDINKFFIKEKRLYYGDNAASAVEFRQLEYVLFSIKKNDKRSDYETLSFYETYKEIMRDTRDKVKARKIEEKDKEEILNRLTALSFDMELSPDLISEQAKFLGNLFKDEIKEILSKQMTWSAGKKREDDYWTKLREEIRNL